MMAEPKNNLFISLLICFILFIVLFDETKVQIVADILKKHAILINSKERERKLQRAMLEVRRRFGLNAIVKGMNLMQGATTMERNTQIGGHRAGAELKPGG